MDISTNPSRHPTGASSLPMLLSATLFFVSTPLCFYLGKYDYDTRPEVRPYKDSGFTVAPDWSDIMWPNYGLAGLHGALVVFICAAHSARGVLLRRLLMLSSIAQLVQTLQDCATRLPDPNDRLRDRTWVYTMYPVQYTLGACFVHFYCANRALSAVAWFISVLGLAVLIPTHAFYTVGVFSGAFAGTLIPVVYHWYVRTSASIMKRPILRWFEQDAISMTPVVATFDIPSPTTPHSSSHYGTVHHPQQHQHHQQHEYPGSGAIASGVVTAAVMVEREAGNSTSSDTYGLAKHDDPSSDYMIEHYRYPTFVGDTFARCETELVDWARTELTPRQRLWMPPVITLLAMSFAGGALVTNVIAVNVSDKNRPIGIPLPEDLLYPILPELPDHTADVMLYIHVGLIALFAVCSSSRFIIFRRVSLPYGIALYIRSLTVPATFLPDPSPICKTREHPPGTTCGDLIPSGHAIAFVSAALVVRRYVGIPWLEALVWAYTTCGIIVVIASRLHYTRDVVTALLLVFTIDHIVYVALYCRPDRMLSFKLLRYFESDVYILRLSEEERESGEGDALHSTTASAADAGAAVDETARLLVNSGGARYKEEPAVVGDLTPVSSAASSTATDRLAD